jgi:hypothetical protein
MNPPSEFGLSRAIRGKPFSIVLESDFCFRHYAYENLYSQSEAAKQWFNLRRSGIHSCLPTSGQLPVVLAIYRETTKGGSLHVGTFAIGNLEE